MLLIDDNAGFTGMVRSGPQIGIAQAAAALARTATNFGFPLVVANNHPAIGRDLVLQS